MSTENKSSSGSPIIGIVIGAALMFGGFYVSKSVHLDFVESLEKQGIPLDPGKTVSIIGVFLILYPVINSFFIKVLQGAINERTSNLESTFAEAENLRAEMKAMKSEYDQRLVATEASAREQIQSQIREAQELRSRLMQEASAQANDFMDKARAEIDLEKQKALSEIRGEVVNLTLKASERLVGETMDNDRNRRLVEEFLSAEVAR